MKFEKSIAIIVIPFVLSGCALLQAGSLSSNFDNQDISIGSWSTTCSTDNRDVLGLPRINSSALSVDSATMVAFEAILSSDELSGLSDFELGSSLLSLDGSAVLRNENSFSSQSLMRNKAANFIGLNIQNLYFEANQGLPVTRTSIQNVELVEASRVIQKLSPNTMIEQASRSDEVIDLSVSPQEWRDFYQEIGLATESKGWTSSAVEALGMATRIGVQSNFNSSNMSASDLNSLEVARKRSLVFEYLTAYFRDGLIFDITVDLSDSELLQQVCQGDPENCFTFAKTGEKSFVTKYGQSHSFPAVSVKINPVSSGVISTNKIDRKDAITDIARVVIEASFDSATNSPGVATSTLCAVRKERCLNEDDPSQVAAAMYATSEGNRAESIATGLTSMLVRGGWLFSLNNETLADVIEVSVGVGARKTAEEVAYRVRASSQCSAEPQMMTLGFE